MEGSSEAGMTKKELGVLAAGLVLATAAFSAHGIRPERADEKATCDSLAKGEPLTNRQFTPSPTINLFHPIEGGTFLDESSLAAETEACKTIHKIEGSVACAAESICATIKAGGKVPATLVAEAKKETGNCPQ